MVTWETRYQEWQALFEFCCENRLELETAGRMRGFVFCLQRHWQDMRKLRGDSIDFLRRLS